MNILYLAHRVPYPPDKGDKIRSCHQIEFLAKRHNVWCATFIDDPADSPHVGALRKWCRDVHAVPLQRTIATIRAAGHLAAGGTLTEGYYRNRDMQTIIEQWCNEVSFDAALIFSSGMAAYRPFIRAGRVVLDFCDFDSAKWRDYADRVSGLRSWLYGAEARRLRNREFDWLGQFDACTVVTNEEADLCHDNSRKRRLCVIGNGAHAGPGPRILPDQVNSTFTFVGQMDYFPNVDAVQWFANDIFPLIRAGNPNATFQIIGRNPANAVRALEQTSGVTVTGAVTNVREQLESCAVSVAPLRIGRGIQNKVLEAMSAARPVVLTSTAAAGINAAHGRQFLIADDASAFAGHCVDLLNAPPERVKLGQAARQWIVENTSWERELNRLETLLVGG